MTKVKRLLVISIDAMVSEDFEYIKNLPNLGPYIREASRIAKVRSIYPSLTLPCHATMMTGVYAGRHHVIHNEEFVPGGENIPWRWFRDQYTEVKTVAELAKENGYTVGCAFWPASGRLNVDWSLHRSWGFTGDEKQDYEGLASGSTRPFLDEIWPDLWPQIESLGEKHYDFIYNYGLCELIRRKKPQVLFQHVSLLDKVRHRKGVFSPEVYEVAWAHHDRLFGEVLQALRDIGELENTTIVITSDHGQLPVKRLIAVNQLFLRDGLVHADEEGRLLSWDAAFESAGHACYVYLKHGGDETLAAGVLSLLRQYQAAGELPVDRILTKKEAADEYGLTGDFAFVLEGADGVAFSNRLTGSLHTWADNSDYKYSVSTHGHMPEKGPQPTFYLCGANVKKGVVVPHANLVDEAPTIAALLGFEMKGVDGRVIEELI